MTLRTHIPVFDYFEITEEHKKELDLINQNLPHENFVKRFLLWSPIKNSLRTNLKNRRRDFIGFSFKKRKSNKKSKRKARKSTNRKSNRKSKRKSRKAKRKSNRKVKAKRKSNRKSKRKAKRKAKRKSK